MTEEEKCILFFNAFSCNTLKACSMSKARFSLFLVLDLANVLYGREYVCLHFVKFVSMPV